MTDVHWPKSFKHLNLKALCAEMDFCHNEAHTALIDSIATDKMLSRAIDRGITSIPQMIEHSLIPWIYVEANATFDQKEAAKKLRYRWEQIDDVRVPKRWINKFKETKLDAAKAAALEAGFSIRRITQ